MSACSSTVGSSLLVEEAELGAEQPDPLHGLDARGLGRRAVGHVGEQLEREAVERGRRAGPAGELLALTPALLDAGAGLVGVGALLDRAGLAVDDDEGAGRELHDPGGADDARDAELPRDDRGVAGRTAALGDQRGHQCRVEAGGVARGEVLGDQDGRLARGRHARRGLAHEVGHHAALDVAQVGDPLGHQAAHGGEDRDELVDRTLHGGDRALPCLEVLAHGSAQALVAGEPGARGEHLGRRALGRGRLGGEGLGHRARRVVVRREGGVGVREVAVAEARDRVGRDLAADVEDGACCDARHDRGPAQAARGSSGCGHGHTVEQGMVDRQHIRD